MDSSRPPGGHEFAKSDVSLQDADLQRANDTLFGWLLLEAGAGLL